MLRRFGPLAIALAATALLGCSNPPPPGESVRESRLPIIGGSLDGSAADDAIVAVLSQQTECTGTIIAQNGTDGYVLTAGHCCDPQFAPSFISIGGDYTQSKPGSGNVTNYARHPSYTLGGPADQPFDFCMVTFTTGISLPIIPAMTSATESVTQSSHTPITAAGYGQTVAGPEGSGGNNSLRKAIGPIFIEGLDAYHAYYDETAGGTCFGDSGGPDLALGTDGVRRVFGVHSFVSGQCDQESGSGIVSVTEVYDDFIVKYLNGQPPIQDCNSCAAAAQSGGACAGAVSTCDANSECAALINCISACNGNSACVQACGSQHPSGLTDYNAIITCICDTACTTECASECGSSSTATSSVASTGVVSLTAGSTSASTGGGGAPGVGGASHAGGGNAGDGGGQNSDTAGNDGGCSWSGGPRDGSSVAALGLLVALAGMRRRRPAR